MYFGILEADTVKKVKMKEKKNNKRVSQTNKKTSRNQVLALESHRMDKHLDCLSCKIHETIFEMDKEWSQMDQRARKLMILRNTLHLRDDIDRLYVLIA